jgi:hypothetical protein
MPPSTDSLAHDLKEGARASLAATTAMSGFFLLVHEAGLLGEPPPRKLTRRILRRAGAFSRLTHGAPLDAAATLAHYGYGMGMGAAYGLIAGRLPTKGARLAAAIGLSVGVWAGSYAGWIPAMNLMRRPSKDRPLRPTVMALLHVVFGAAWGLCFESRREENR